MHLDLPVPRTALAIGAHPDDVEFGSGATLAKWAAAGCAVSHLVCTDGSKGSWDPGEDVAELIATRQVEQRAAARALGATGTCTFLGEVDGELVAGLDQRERVARVPRALRAVGAHEVRDGAAGGRPLGQRGAGAELDVVGVGADGQGRPRHRQV